jgi:hypothetical protein
MQKPAGNPELPDLHPRTYNYIEQGHTAKFSATEAMLDNTSVPLKPRAFVIIAGIEREIEKDNLRLVRSQLSATE